MNIKCQNKWVRGAIPALLLHCSIGTVYCWSVFSTDIAKYIGWGKSSVEWAFSLAIFFLGMSAAFLGNVVEKNIHRSSLIASITFGLGMVGTGLCIWYGGAHPGSVLALIGIFVCYGFIMGIGLGTGYLSPVKTLMLWFSENKGLATGLAVAGFGAAKVIASPIMKGILSSDPVTDVGQGSGVWKMFLIMGCVYFDGFRVYVAGDTEPIGEMSEFGNIDLAFLPVNQPYTMTVSQCVEAAELIRPKTLIPYHYSDTDLSGLSESLKGIEVIIPQFTCFPPCSETSQRR